VGDFVGLPWLFAPLAVAGFGVLLFLFGIAHLFRGHVGRAGSGFLIGTLFAAVGFAGSLIALNTQTYARLTHEAPVARVTVNATDATQNRYSVTVSRTDGVEFVRTCDIEGEEFLISARVQKWKPWANVLGLDTTYALDQIANKYSTAERGNGKLITACDLTGPAPEANTYVPPEILAWLLGQSYTEDRKFGSANYMPLADGATYKVVITQSGLNTEPENESAKSANDNQS